MDLKSAYNAGSQGGMKLTNFSGSTIHNIVLKAGHGIGYKFKPWQAVKITKGVAIAGQALAVVGVGLSVLPSCLRLAPIIISCSQNFRAIFVAVYSNFLLIFIIPYFYTILILIFFHNYLKRVLKKYLHNTFI